MSEDIVKLTGLKEDEVPADFRAETYFDFRAHPFAHQALFEQTTSVYGAILALHEYAATWLAATIASKRATARTPPADAPPPTYTAGRFEVLLEAGAVFAPARIIGSAKAGESYTIYLEQGARVIGADIYLDQGSIYIGAGATVEPGVGIKGPTIVGQRTEIRQGAYLRGDCILGDDGVVRGEIKNAVLMDQASFPHPCYVGDSACGYRTHFGNQVTAANLGIYEGVRDSDKRQPLVIRCGGKAYDFGQPKMGICLGDFSQIGCSSVSDPGTFLKPYTIAYALTRLAKGFYGPNEILKNKPMEHGVVERAPLQPLG